MKEGAELEVSHLRLVEAKLLAHLMGEDDDAFRVVSRVFVGVGEDLSE